MKKEITRERYWEIINENGGLDELQVFGAYTELAGFVGMHGYAPEDDDVYTEWGRKGAEMPLVASRRIGNHEKGTSKWIYYEIKKTN